MIAAIFYHTDDQSIGLRDHLGNRFVVERVALPDLERVIGCVNVHQVQRGLIQHRRFDPDGEAIALTRFTALEPDQYVIAYSANDEHAVVLSRDELVTIVAAGWIVC